MRIWLILISIFSCQTLLAAEDYPDEFADFFTEQEEQIQLLIAGEKSSRSIKAKITIDNFTLIQSEQNLNTVREYLTKKGIKTSFAKNIEKDLINGISADNDCTGLLSQCVPKDKANQAEYIFDFDAKQLKIFISSEMLKIDSSKDEYYPVWRKDNAFINNSNLYLNVNKNYDSQITWDNHSYLGLPLGYFSLETQYHTLDQSFDVYEALYDVEEKNIRAIVGYQDRTRKSVNSTDLLGYRANFSGLGITIGSSNNLIKGEKNSRQRIYFYTPQAGQLEIYQGEKLILTRSVNEGQQYINYDLLPVGVYNLTLIVRQGSKEIFKEQRQINNTSKLTLPLNHWDFVYQLGYLENDLIEQKTITQQDKHYYRTAFAHRLTESLLVLSGIMGTAKENAFQLGGNWYANKFLNLQYSSSFFNSGTFFQFAQINLSPFSFALRQLNFSDEQNPFAILLYGDEDFIEWSGGISGQFLGGSGYLSYLNYQTQTNNNQSISASWSKELFGGNFSTSFSLYENNNSQENWSANISWSKKFGKKSSAQFSVQSNANGFVYQRTNLNHAIEGKRWQASANAGLTVSKSDHNFDLSLVANGDTDHFRYNVFAHTDDNTNHSVSGSLSSTQIISTSSNKLTYLQGNSFISITPQLDQPTQTDLNVNYQFLRNGKNSDKGEITANQLKMFSVPAFSETEINLDVESQNALINLDYVSKFNTPGSYLHIEPQITPFESQIMIFSDINKNPLTSIRCKNKTCKSVEQISDDGVFRIDYFAGENFQLSFGKNDCFYNFAKLGDPYLSAYCIPNIELIKNHNIDSTNTKHEQLYLKFNNPFISSNEKEKIMQRIKEMGMKATFIMP